MSDPSPAIDLDALLAERDFVRRLARGLLFDEHRADDVVQQTWLDALRKAPQATGGPALRGWLATVVRRRVADDLAAHRRREQAERDAAPVERPMPSADELIAREELRRIVVAELDALPEPYRTAVALRYLEGAEPVEIASRLGVPAATIRARVRRGLAMLREGLDRRHGGDRRAWSLALVPLAAPGSAGAVTGMAAVPILLITGVAVKLLSSIVLLGAAALVMFLVWPVGAPLPGRPSPLAAVDDDPDRTVNGTDADVAAAVADAPQIAATAERTREAVVPVARGPASTRVRGRCVDEQGAPLVGVQARLRGELADGSRLADWLLEHDDEPHWTDPDPATTDHDGRFAFCFEPIPPLAFRLDLEADAGVPVDYVWPQLVPGADFDLGDIVVRPGTRLRGHVVDMHGAPVAHAPVEVRPPAFGATRERLLPFAGALRARQSTRTDAAGRFEFEHVVPAGDYVFEVPGRQVVKPPGVVRIDGHAHERTITATRVPDDRPTISGVVIDAAGAPLAGVLVGSGELPAFPDAEAPDAAISARDGAFVLRPSTEADDAPIVLRAFRDGYARWASAGEIDWGTEGVRVVMHRGPALTVRVTADDAPVERFGIVLAPQRPDGRGSAYDDRVRIPGRHPGGVATLHVTPGHYRMAVRTPESLRLVQLAPVELEVSDRSPADVTVQMARIVEQTVMVVEADGAPVPGLRLELGRHCAGGEVTAAMMLIDSVAARRLASEHVGILDHEVITDAAGRATLLGATVHTYALRASKTGRTPEVFQPILLGSDQPLRIALAPSGVLRGRLGPVAVLDELRRAGPSPDGTAVAIALHGLDARAGETLPPDVGASRFDLAVAPDGRFAVHGVPPGIWQVRLRWKERNAVGYTQAERVAIERIEIAAGNTVSVEADLSAWLRHTVAIETLVGGEPRMMDVQGAMPDGQDTDGRPRWETVTLRTDSTGRGTLRLKPGTWQFDLGAEVDGVAIRTTGTTLVVTGDVPANAPVRLGLNAAARRVRVLRPDGQPAEGLLLDVTVPHDPLRPWSMPRCRARPTNADGRTVIRGPAGTRGVRVIREPFLADEAFEAWLATHPDAGEEQRFIDIGTVELIEGDGDVVELRLPAAWSQLPD